MRHTILTALFSVLLLLCSTAGHRCYGQESNQTDLDSLDRPGLNTPGEIRYADRCIRSTIDAYLESGLDQPGIAAEQLAPYRDIFSGKFAICYAEHYLFGGLFISFVFVDEPGKIFTTWVYSFTDAETKTISGYEMRGLTVEEESPFESKEELLYLICQSNAILF